MNMKMNNVVTNNLRYFLFHAIFININKPMMQMKKRAVEKSNLNQTFNDVALLHISFRF